MKELRLQYLHCRNFKGLRDYTFTPNGQDADIFAANAKGKTSLADGERWLWWGKDSANRADFELKPLDENGQAIHGLETDVEGAYTLDGQPLTLRRVYSETWTKKRGSAEKLLTGHSTAYWIDGVPVKQKEYQAKIAEICDESVFRLLTAPAYFCEVMKWQERRALLLDVSGDITDADVIAGNGDLETLPNILAGRSLDDHRKVLAERRKKINEEIKALPIRIDEITQGLPELSGPQKSIEDQLARLRTQVQEKHLERARIENGGEVAEKKRRLAEIEAELFRLAGAMWDEASKEGEAGRQERARLRDELAKAESDYRMKGASLGDGARRVADIDAELEALRQQWRNVDGEGYEGYDICPTCGQDLPDEQLEAARAAHNRSKAERLAANQAKGQDRAEEMKKQMAENLDAEREVARLKSVVDGLRQQLETLPAVAEPAKKDPMENAQYAALSLEKEAVAAEIEQLGAGTAGALATIDEAIDQLQTQIRELDETLAQFTRRERDLERIEELKAEERALAAEFERLESELFLMEQFTRSKVALLEERINGRFRLARFRMFEEQLNGGISECCECTVDGVPYSGGLNTGARIRVGLDIITTLAEHFGFVAPIFVDNAESITDPIVAPGQLIRLIASPAGKALRVETQKPRLAEVANG